MRIPQHQRAVSGPSRRPSAFEAEDGKEPVEPGVAPQRVKKWIDRDEGQVPGPLSERLLEGGQRRVSLTQAQVHHRDAEGRHIPGWCERLQTLEHPPCFSRLSPDRQRVSKLRQHIGIPSGGLHRLPMMPDRLPVKSLVPVCHADAVVKHRECRV